MVWIDDADGALSATRLGDLTCLICGEPGQSLNKYP